MCTTVPLKVTKISDNFLEVEGKRRIKRGLVKNVSIGDYVIAYANIALEKVHAKNAQFTRKQFRARTK